MLKKIIQLITDMEPPFFKRDGFFPVDFDEAEKWLEDFLQQCFIKFGVYKDAMVKEQGLLTFLRYHPCSMLACLPLNK
jgi:deoxyribodipyrimidine photolyase-like uncharacterized protein